MSRHIEKLMINSADERENGWIRLNSEELGKEFNNYNHNNFRSITIGSQSNCNEDGLICDKTTNEKIKDIMKKYNIIDYRLNIIHNDHIFASQLVLEENMYNKLINSIK
jgi:hypothetical protein